MVGIYCQFDGYPSGVGKRLRENYSSDLSLHALLALGDISSLGDTTESTTAYHRDRGEDYRPARVYKTAYEALSEEGAFYAYVFEDDGSWKTYDRNGKELKDSV